MRTTSRLDTLDPVDSRSHPIRSRPIRPADSARALLYAAILTLCWASGCVRYQPRPLSAERSADTFAARSLDDPRLREFLDENLASPVTEWPLGSWDFEHLTLAAYYFHPDLDVARAHWAVARAGQRTAGQLPNPTLAVSPGLNLTTTTPSPWLVTVTLDVPIETAGKRQHRQARAEGLSEAARLDVAAVAWQVRADVRSKLVELEAARSLHALLAQENALRSRMLEILDAQLDAGAISAYDAGQLRIATNNARIELRETQRRVELARVGLAAAIGLPTLPDETEISAEGLDHPPDESAFREARTRALHSRADILAALADYAASEADLRLEIAKQYPDLHFNPGYEFDQADNKWALGLSVELPILNQNRGPIAEAEARRRESAARFEALQARVLADIEIALAGLRAARAQLVEAEALRAGLERAEQSARANFEAGGLSELEWIGLQLQNSASERARLAAVTRAQQDLGDLEMALQGPIDQYEALWNTPDRSAGTAMGNP